MFSSHSRLSAQDAHLKQGILGMFSTPLLGSFVYAHGYRLPLTCPIRYVTGFPCPTCGMTRSFMAIGQGHWLQAMTFHCLGPILFCLCAGIVVHVTFELVTQKQWSTVYSRFLSQREVQFLGIGIYLGYYFLRLLFIGYPE